MESPKKAFREKFHDIFLRSERFPFTLSELLKMSPYEVQEIYKHQDEYNEIQYKALQKLTNK